MDVSLSEPKNANDLGLNESNKSPGPVEKMVVVSGFDEGQTKQPLLSETIPCVQAGAKGMHDVACSRK